MTTKADEKTTETTENPPANTNTPPTGGTDDVAELKAQLSGLSEQVAHMAGLVLAEVPERFKPLIPEGLSPAAQAAWAVKARQSGLFGPVGVPETDGGKKPTVTPQVVDLNSLSAHERIKAGYKSSKGN